MVAVIGHVSSSQQAADHTDVVRKGVQAAKETRDHTQVVKESSDDAKVRKAVAKFYGCIIIDTGADCGLQVYQCAR